MIHNNKIFEIIKCQSSDTQSHIVEEPIRLPCGFSMCDSCYKVKKNCNICKIEHIIDGDKLKTSDNVVNKVIIDNIKELTRNIQSRIEITEFINES